MSSLRIKGVVGFADRVRRELSGPVSEARKSQLRGEVAELIRQVDQIVVRRGTRIERLPLPTRQAYHFLANLDFDAAAPVAASDLADANEPSSGTVRLVGVKSYWQNILRRLALASSADNRDELHDSIRSTCQKIEHNLEEQGLRARDLTTQSCTIRGWLAFFASRENFDAYVAAIDRARSVFEAVLRRTERLHPPAIIEFQPISGLYKLRGYRNETRVILPTPMIVFSSELFVQLADASLANGDKQPVMAATASDEYQSVQAELQALSGEEERTAGAHRDLGASFDRVNGKYFDNSLARPRLTWSRTFTGRKFGHYDPIRDTVLVSCSLDRTDLPEHALDYVVYHELLHKRLGVDWRNGRAAAHTHEFRKQERGFHRYSEAEAALKKLASGGL